MHPVDRRKYHRKLLVVVKMPTNLLASCSFLLLRIFFRFSIKNFKAFKFKAFKLNLKLILFDIFMA